MADDTYWNDEAEESLRKAQMIHCFEFIDKEYTRVWDTFDINDQQQFLDYMKERHNLHTVEKSVNKENPSLNGKSNSNKLKDELMGFFPMQSNNTDEEDDIILPF